MSPKGSTADSAAGGYTVTATQSRAPSSSPNTPWQREQFQPHKVTMDTMSSLMAPKSCFKFFVCSFSLVGVFPNTSWRLAQKHGLDWMLFAFAEPLPESDRAGVPGAGQAVSGQLCLEIPLDPYLLDLEGIISVHCTQGHQKLGPWRGCGLHRGGNKTCTHIYFT